MKTKPNSKPEGADTMSDTMKYWDILVESGLATAEELRLITSINGQNEDTMESVLYVRTGYRSFDQYAEEGE